MSRPRRLHLASATIAVGIVVTLAACHLPESSRDPYRSVQLGRVVRASHCIDRSGLPDRRCTPGAVLQGVTLAAICRYGYSRSVRPPVAYTERLKFTDIRAYGLRGRAADYEEDHLVPLALGGAPTDPANLWPQPRYGPHTAEQKDELEAWAARAACDHRAPLAQLQRAFALDWVALYAAVLGNHRAP